MKKIYYILSSILIAFALFGFSGFVQKADAAIAYRSSSTATFPGATSVSIAMPTGTVQGDVMVASIFGNANQAAILGITPPAGWTQVQKVDNTTGSYYPTVALFTKPAGAGEAGPYVFTFSNYLSVAYGGAWIATYTGVNTTTPVDVSGSQNIGNSGATTTTYSTPSITTTGANEMLVFAYIGNCATNGFGTPPTPAGVSVIASNLVGGCSRGAGFYVTQAAAGVSGNITSTAATSSYGGAAILALKQSGPTVVPSSATNITATSAIINSTLIRSDSNSTNLFYPVGTTNTTCNSISPEYYYGSFSGGGGTYSPNAYALSGLTPNTDYYFCARAYDTVTFQSTYSSDVLTFRTLVGPPTMERVTKGEITTTTASITGNIANQNGASILEKGVCYSSTNTLPAVSQGGTNCTSNGTGTAAYTASITGLTANTLYYFRAYARNSAGPGYSAVDTFTTETTPPTGFPQVVSTGGFYDRSNATVHNIPMPTAVNANDLLLVLISSDGSATISVPAGGWTSLATGANGSSIRSSVWYKFAVGNEGGTTVNFQTSASESMTAQVYRIANAEAVEAGTVATGATSSPDSPSLTPTWGATDSLWIPFAGYDYSSAAVSNYPASYTNGRRDADTYQSSQNQGALMSARRYLNATTENPAAFTVGVGGPVWVANTVAVKPQPSTPDIASPPTQANVTHNSATLGGNITSQGGSAVDVRGVCYSVTATNASPEHGGTGVTCANHASGGTGIFTVNVTSLEPETGYSYKAFAHNTQGYAYTSADTFATLTNAPTGVTTNNESELGSYKVRFHGSANPNGSQAYGYFRFFTSVPDCTVDSGGTRIPSSSSFDYDLGSGNSPVAFDLPTPTTINLTRNTDYWYCAYARNDAAGPSNPGTSSGAGYDTFTTTDGPASGCDSPASGSLTVTEACSFLQSDYDGVDAGGSGSSNTGVLTLGSGGIVTILPGQRIARGGIVMAGGGMAIGNGNGGVIRGGLWLKDADGDGWVDSPIVKVVSSTQPAGFIRRNHAYTLPAYNSTDFNYASKFYNADSNNPDLLDCDGTNFYKYRNVPNLVRDADRDGYKTAAAPATVCVGASTVINGRTYYNDGSGEN